MALLRLELAVNNLGSNDIYDCMCETSSDFAGDTVLKDKCGVGSLAYCLGDDKVYVKKSTGWVVAS